MGFGIGSITDFGKSLLGGEKAGFKTNKGALYQPYSFKSLTGTTELEKDGNKYTFSQQLTPELEALYGASLAQAQPFLQQYLAAAQTQLPQFGFSADPRAREAEIFQQQANLLQPELLRQQTQARDAMFNMGRLGLRLSSDTAGAGADAGMINPDAYALNLAQSRAIAELAPQAREMAQTEQQQAFDQARNIFDINQLQRQQQLQNLYSGYMGAMGGVRNIFDIERQLVGDAAARERDIRMAASGAAIPTQGSSGALGGILTGLASNPSLFTTSDVRLKQDLVSLGKVNGHKMYSWNWTDKAISMGFGKQSTIGVLAQEVLEYMPEAVAMFDDGYYRVNYDILYGSTFNNAGES